MHYFDGIFSKNELNKGRQIEVDIAKAIILFYIAFVHIFIECSTEQQLASGLGYFFDTVIGGPFGAPIFSFSMGCTVMFARKHDSISVAKRGVGLFIGGFIFNIFRWTIPSIIGYLITGDYTRYIEPIIYKTFYNDILQFAGMALITIATFMYFNIADKWLFVTAAVASVLGTLLTGIDLKNPVLNIVAGYFIGTEDAECMVMSDFVYLNWLIVPVTGYLFGKALIHMKDKKRFYQFVSPVSLAICAVAFIVEYINKWGMFGFGEYCYYHISTIDVLLCILLVFGLLGVYYFLSRHLSHGVIAFFEYLSLNLTNIYVIHWILIGWIVNLGIYVIFGTLEIGNIYIIIVSAVITVLSMVLAFRYTEFRRKRKHA